MGIFKKVLKHIVNIIGVFVMWAFAWAMGGVLSAITALVGGDEEFFKIGGIVFGIICGIMAIIHFIDCMICDIWFYQEGSTL